jgi:hypothetical protein
VTSHPTPAPGSIDTGWLRSASDVIADLGFSIVTGGHPDNPVATDLVVALRDEPTLLHFDPEEVSYWVPEGGRGRPRHVERATSVPFEGRFSWGRIEIVDRVGASNHWLSFGGTVHAAAHDDTTTIVMFVSPTPIQRWSGHSQGMDPLTPEIGAFFGRLMIPIDFEPGAEALIAAAPPQALYCAFLQDVHAREHRSQQFREADRSLSMFVEHEVHRLPSTEPADWRAGADLLAELGVGLPA